MKELLDTGEITKTFASDTIASLSEKEQVDILINMIKDAPHNELILLKNTLDEISGIQK